MPAFFPDGTRLVSCGSENQLKIWDLRDEFDELTERREEVAVIAETFY